MPQKLKQLEFLGACSLILHYWTVCIGIATQGMPIWSDVFFGWNFLAIHSVALFFFVLAVIARIEDAEAPTIIRYLFFASLLFFPMLVFAILYCLLAPSKNQSPQALSTNFCTKKN